MKKFYTKPCADFLDCAKQDVLLSSPVKGFVKDGWTTEDSMGDQW